MKTRILTPIVLVWLFVGSSVFAVESDKTGMATDNGKKTAVDAPRDGVWVGVIEDIQHLKDTDGFKLTDGALFADEMMRVFTESSRSFLAYLFIRDNVSVTDPQFFMVTLRQANNNLGKFVIHERLQWNVGDRIEITKTGNSVSVKTLELGELSRYAAEQEAARNK